MAHTVCSGGTPSCAFSRRPGDLVLAVGRATPKPQSVSQPWLMWLSLLIFLGADWGRDH